MTKYQLIEAQKQIEREQLLKKIISVIRSSLDIDKVKESIINEVASAFNADGCFIRLFQTDKDINDAEYFNVKSSYSFPLWNSSEFVGVFGLLYTKEKVVLNDDEIELLKAIADQAAIAIKQAEMFTTIKQKAEKEELLRRITQNIRKSLDLNEVLDNICFELSNLFNVDKIAISKYSESMDNTPVWTFLVEYQNEDLPMLASISPSHKTSLFFAKEIFDEGKNIVINDIDNVDYPDYMVAIYKNLNVKSLLAIPIKKDNENWGAIGLVEYHSCRHWSEDEIHLIETIANQISIAIKQAEMFSTIKQKTEREELLRSDESIVISKNLAKNLGLNCAITYCTLASKYYYSKDESKILKKGYCLHSITELAKVNCLSVIEQRHAIDRLAEIDLIKCKKLDDNKDQLYFKIVNDESYIAHYLSDNTFDEEIYLPISKLCSEPIFCEFSELYKTYSNYFSKESVEATKYFLLKSKQVNNLDDLRISKLYFSVICRTLHSFMVKNKLSLDVMKLLINYWFQKDSFISETNVINLDSPNKILLGRLKKILFYRFLEARTVMATNFNSKMDFYYSSEMEDKDFLRRLFMDMCS